MGKWDLFFPVSYADFKYAQKTQYFCSAPAAPSPMAAIHSLDKHCRVCGGRLQRVKGRKSSGKAHACTDHRQALLQTFDIDVAEDCVAIHPSHFCHGCYLVTGRQAAAASKASAYHHSISLFAWSKHTKDECEVYTHALYMITHSLSKRQ